MPSYKILLLWIVGVYLIFITNCFYSYEILSTFLKSNSQTIKILKINVVLDFIFLLVSDNQILCNGMRTLKSCCPKKMTQFPASYSNSAETKFPVVSICIILGIVLLWEIGQFLTLNSNFPVCHSQWLHWPGGEVSSLQISAHQPKQLFLKVFGELNVLSRENLYIDAWL